MERVLRKVKNIFTGWFLVLIFWDSQQAKERRAICQDCPYRKGMFCGECGCHLKAKSQIEEEECPKGFWGIKKGI